MNKLVHQVLLKIQIENRQKLNNNKQLPRYISKLIERKKR